MNNYWQHNSLPNIPEQVNLITHWIGSDNEENFKKTLRPGYNEKSIIYRYNSLGYRSQEIDLSCSKPSVICIGCSFTEGVGVNYEESWPAHVEQAFPDHLVYNFGLGGSSGDYVARTLYNIGNLLKTEIVFILWPSMFRYEIYNDTNIDRVLPQWTDGNLSNKTAYSSSKGLIDSNFYNIRQKNKAIVDLLKIIYKYQVVEYNTGYDGNKQNLHDVPLIKVHDKGRDNHPGPGWHKELARLFLTKYNVQSKI
jgi:hypothetical protein